MKLLTFEDAHRLTRDSGESTHDSRRFACDPCLDPLSSMSIAGPSDGPREAVGELFLRSWWRMFASAFSAQTPERTAL